MSSRKLIFCAASACLLCSCSTVKVLSEGEYRLASNEIVVANDKKFSTADLRQYIQQKENTYVLFGWSPGLYIYNWGGKSDSRFAAMLRKIGQAPVVFNQSKVGKSIENISSRLQSLGYFDSRVTARVDTSHKIARVKYDVTLGRRIPIDKIVYDLPESSPEFVADFKRDSSGIGIREGDFLSEVALENESVRGTGYFRDRGFYSLTKNNYFFSADTASVPGKARLTYSIKPYGRGQAENANAVLARYSIGRVNVTHNEKLKISPSVLKGIITVRPGDTYSAADITTTYDRIASLGMVSGVSVEMTPRDSSIVDCDIKFSESSLQGFKASFEMSSSANGLFSLVPQLTWHHKNIFHGGERLSLGFTGNFQFKDQTRAVEFGATAGLSIPGFLGIHKLTRTLSILPRTDLKAAYNYQNRPEYKRDLFSLSMNYNGNSKSKRMSYQLYPLRMNLVRLYNLSPEFQRTLDRNPYMRYSYQDHFDAGVGGTIGHQTDPAPMPRNSYSYSRVNLELSGNALSLFNRFMPTNSAGQRMLLGAPYSQYFRTEVNLGRVFRWGKENGQAFAVHFVAGLGYAYGNSSSMPFERQFYVGGANGMRAWQARSLGPGMSPVNKSFSIPSQAGDVKMELDFEYRFKIYGIFEGALFAETGNVWTHDKNDDTGSFRWSDFHKGLAGDWGLGLRLNLSLIVFRADIGFKIYEPSYGGRWFAPADWFKSNGCAFHIGVGYPF